jgi:hypothetical protein
MISFSHSYGFLFLCNLVFIYLNSRIYLAAVNGAATLLGIMLLRNIQYIASSESLFVDHSRGFCSVELDNRVRSSFSPGILRHDIVLWKAARGAVHHLLITGRAVRHLLITVRAVHHLLITGSAVHHLLITGRAVHHLLITGRAIQSSAYHR